MASIIILSQPSSRDTLDVAFHRGCTYYSPALADAPCAKVPSGTRQDTSRGLPMRVFVSIDRLVRPTGSTPLSYIPSPPATAVISYPEGCVLHGLFASATQRIQSHKDPWCDTRLPIDVVSSEDLPRGEEQTAHLPSKTTCTLCGQNRCCRGRMFVHAGHKTHLFSIDSACLLTARRRENGRTSSSLSSVSYLQKLLRCHFGEAQDEWIEGKIDQYTQVSLLFDRFSYYDIIFNIIRNGLH